MKSLRKKTISILSYITIIGWIIAYFNYKKKNKSSLIKFHLEQSFGLIILSIISNSFFYFISLVIPNLEILLIINNMILLVFCIAGIISASYGVRLALPLIGTFFEDKFRFIE